MKFIHDRTEPPSQNFLSFGDYPQRISMNVLKKVISMASSLRSLKAQAGAAAAVMFSAGVITAGALSYDAMRKTLDQGHGMS